MQSRRIDLEREISIRVPAFDSFITEYSSNISTTGMFIRSDKPMPPDTKLSFEFKVADDWQLIRGKATVVWSRYRDEGPDRLAGMGVLFTELDPQSRRLILWIIEKHVRDGGTPFDLGELRDSYDDSADETEKDEVVASPTPAVTHVIKHPKVTAERAPARSRKGPARFRLGSLLLAGILVAGVLGLLFWLSERSAQMVANPDLPTGEQPGVAREAGADAGDPADPSNSLQTTTPATSTGSAGDSEAEVGAATVSPIFARAAQELVAGWARDWSKQDVDGYLSHYAQEFQPANGQSRGAWEASRRDRIRAPEFIQVSITELEAEATGDSRGRALFDQSYRSDSYEDTVRKAMVLVSEDGRWKIAEETVLN